MVAKSKKMQLSVLPAVAAFVCGFFAANAAQQAPERAKVPTVTLGIVSATNQTLIADHFGDFVRYVGGKLNPGSVVEGKVVIAPTRSEEHTSELQSLRHLVCRLLLEKKKNYRN